MAFLFRDIPIPILYSLPNSWAYIRTSITNHKVLSTLYIYYVVCEATCFGVKRQSSSYAWRIYTNKKI